MDISKKSKRIPVPLEEQLAHLRQIGIAPCCNDFTDWILAEWGKDRLEAGPYGLLLDSLGTERELAGQWVPVSNDIYCFDTECVEDGAIYAHIFMNLRRIAKGAFDISEVTSAVDHDAKTASVSFRYKGKAHHWGLHYDGDWLDDSIFYRINELIDVPKDACKFYIAQPGQSVQLVCKTRAQVEQLNILTPVPFLDTAFAPRAVRDSVAEKAPPPAFAAASRAKKPPKAKGPISSQIPFIIMVCGFLLIIAGNIYQKRAGRATNYTAVIVMMIFAFALIIISGLLIAKKNKRTQKQTAPAKPVKLTEEEIAKTMAVLAPTVQPYIALHPVRRPTGVYDSKFGGTPYLPPGFAYPHDTKNNMPLRLLCQLNFERLPRLPGFPEGGILQFYLSCDSSENTDYMYGLDFDNRCEQTRWRVVYHRDIVKDETLLQSPPELLPEQESFFPFTGELALEAELSSMPLLYGDYRWDDFRESVWGKTEIARRLVATYSHYDEELLLSETLDKDVHKIGGYPNFAQEDPRSYSCNAHTVLLLQVGSDLDIMWGDSGFANFFITPEALEKCDFSNVMYNWDCY